jgi:HK97 family phage major capsid protein
MKWSDLQAKLKDKGVDALHKMTEEDLVDLASAMKISNADLVALAKQSARDEVKAELEASAERHRKIQSGEITDNGAAGGGDPKAPIIKYERVNASQFCSVPMATNHGSGSAEVVIPRFRDRTGSEIEAMFATIRSRGLARQKFNFLSVKNTELTAATSETDPSNAGLRMPEPFEQAMVDTYIAAAGWLNAIRKITGPSDRFFYPVRSRNFDPTTRQKTLSSVTATVIAEDSTPLEVSNTPFGYAEGKALPIACYGKITRNQLRGVPNSVNDFMTEMTRGISDHLSYWAAWGEGPAKNEPLGFISQVDDLFKPIEVTRATASRVKRADVRSMRKKLIDFPYLSSGAFWMGREVTVDNLGDEVDADGKPIWNEWRNSISSPASPGNVLGYPVTHNWQSPILGTKGDLCLLSPAALWVFMQEAISIRSSDAPEFLKGNLTIVADTGFNCGVVSGLNDGVIVLK